MVVCCHQDSGCGVVGVSRGVEAFAELAAVRELRVPGLVPMGIVHAGVASRVSGLGCGFQGTCFRLSGLGFMVERTGACGLRRQDSGVRTLGLKVMKKNE